MPIEKSPGYKTSDGTWHATVRAAQRQELRLLLPNEAYITALDSIMENAEAVMSILRDTGRKPRAKKAKVGRPRKVKSVAANGDTPINNNKEKAI